MINNYSKLRGRIKEKFGTQQKFANAIGMGTVSLSKKLNGKSFFNQNDIIIICCVLDIDEHDLCKYFF